MPYSSSLTDEEWEILEPLLPTILPPKKQTRPSNWTKRELLDGIFYQLKNGCNWEDLPCVLAPLLNRILALLAVAGIWSDRQTDGYLTFSSA
ncbi:transposase [Nostoc sp.]|uniref:transposase n=1 Tax=Nostoc sp. TaxID=1180 RepID=UPI002FF9913D